MAPFLIVKDFLNYTLVGVFSVFFEAKFDIGYFVFWLWVEVVDKMCYIFL